jgi:hypothetical protein
MHKAPGLRPGGHHHWSGRRMWDRSVPDALRRPGPDCYSALRGVFGTAAIAFDRPALVLAGEVQPALRRGGRSRTFARGFGDLRASVTLHPQMQEGLPLWEASGSGSGCLVILSCLEAVLLVRLTWARQVEGRGRPFDPRVGDQERHREGSYHDRRPQARQSLHLRCHHRVRQPQLPMRRAGKSFFFSRSVSSDLVGTGSPYLGVHDKVRTPGQAVGSMPICFCASRASSSSAWWRSSPSSSWIPSGTATTKPFRSG